MLPYLPAEVPPRRGAALRLADRARALSDTVQADTLDACGGLSSSLDCGPFALEVQATCETARACLAARLASVPTPTAHVIGGRCEASVGLSVACTTECAGDAPCQKMCQAAVELDSFCLLPKIVPAVADSTGKAVAAWLPPLDVLDRHRGPLARAALDGPTTAALAELTGDDVCSAAARRDLLDARSRVGRNVDAAAGVVAAARLDDAPQPTYGHSVATRRLVE